MSTRSTGTLNTDFPVDTIPHLVASIAKFDNLVKVGMLGEQPEVVQLEARFGVALDAIAETAVIASVTPVGAAGTTTYNYVAIPEYLPEAGAKFLPKPPLQGRGNNQAVRTVRYGKVGTSVQTTTGNATLNGTNYNAIVAPSASAITGTNFTIAKVNADTTLSVVATGVAAGATVNDKGTYLGVPAAQPAHAEVGNNAGTAVFGPRTFGNV